MPDFVKALLPVLLDAPGLPDALAVLVDEAAGLAREARSKATRRAYAADRRDFEGWCQDHRMAHLPAAPVTVGLYLTSRAGSLSTATLVRRISAISVAHRAAGHHLDTRHPAIRDVMAGLRRTRGVAPRQAVALTVPLAKRAVATCGDRLLDLRDCALILVGLAGGFRRSELVALDVTDLTISGDGIRVRIRRSKGDQDGAGQVVGINRTGSPTCPVAALQTWLEAAGIAAGRVFRAVDRHGRLTASLSDRAVALILKSRAHRAGLDPAGISGHSLRAGFATSAARAGIEERVIAQTTRHRSMTVLQGYIREGQMFDRNIAVEMGL